MTLAPLGTRHVLSAVMALSIFAGACGGHSALPPQSSAAPAEPLTVETVRVVQQPVDVALSMPGQLDPFEAVAVYPKVTGFVKTIAVDRGSRVRAGQLMVQLDAPEIIAQRAEAQSKVEAAEAQLSAARAKAEADASTYDKLKSASATPGVVAGNDLVLAQKAVEGDRSQIAASEQTSEGARQALKAVTELQDYLRVTAPFDGVVTERNVHPGALVGPNSGSGASTPMVRLVKTDRLRLVVPVPEAYVAEVKNGTPVSFSVPSYPGRTFTGSIARVSGDIDARTPTMAVELDVVNTDRTLVPGTFCQVRWPIRRPDPSLFVPSGSVASTTDRTFVVRVRDGKAEWVDVRTGLTSGSLTEVFGDLRAGDTVAARGTDEVKAGTSVRAKDVTPAKS